MAIRCRSGRVWNERPARSVRRRKVDLWPHVANLCVEQRHHIEIFIKLAACVDCGLYASLPPDELFPVPFALE